MAVAERMLREWKRDGNGEMVLTGGLLVPQVYPEGYVTLAWIHLPFRMYLFVA